MKLTEIARLGKDNYITIDKEPNGWRINWHESGTGKVRFTDGLHASKEAAKRALKREYSAEEFAMLREAD